MKLNKYLALFLSGLILALSGCSTGLGEAVDLRGPTLVLINPSVSRECFTDNFTIKGTTEDDYAVKSVSVTLDGAKGNLFTFKNENGTWYVKTDTNPVFTPYAQGKWSLNGKKVTWEIPDVNIAESGSVILRATSIDTSGNTSTDSEKKLPIIIDKDPPVVTMTSPVIRYTDSALLLEEMGSSVRDHKSLSIVNKVETKGFTIAGTTKAATKVQEVNVFVRTVNPDTGEVSDTDLISKKLTLSDQDSLRTFSIPVTESDLSSLGSSKSFLQISTISKATKEDEGRVVQGYIVYWPEANIPWITVKLGSSETPENIYAGSSIYGTAYDNIQIKEVLLNVYTKEGNVPVEGFINKAVYTYDPSSGETTQSSGFELPFPQEIGDYKVVVSAADNEETPNPAESITGYVSVIDKTFPSLKLEEITNPFGDVQGNFSIKIRALDDTSVKTVKVKLCETPEDKKEYSNKTSPAWNTPTKTFSSFTTPTGTIIDDNITKKYFDFTYDLNIFDAPLSCGINSVKKLTDKTFIFLIEDNQGNKTLSKFVTPGDTVIPSVTFDKINDFSSDIQLLNAFTEDFKLSGTWSDNSYDVWGENGKDGKPKLTVKVRGVSVSPSNITLSSDRKWECKVPLSMVKEGGAVVGAMDIEIDIEDIGGNSRTIDKGYQIDTNKLALSFVAADKASGTYKAGTEFNISLHFNKNALVEGTPFLNLNNNKTASYVSGSGSRVLNFKYTAVTGDDVKKLLVSSINLTNSRIHDGLSDYMKADLDAALTNPENVINKDICILTTIPAYLSHSWNNETGVLTVVFKGLVSAKEGTIDIIQDDTTQKPLYVPAVLTKDEYNNTSQAVQNYYEEGTNGADSAFNPDLTTKYILKYDYNTDGTTDAGTKSNLVADYKATKAHIKSVNILSENVSVSQHDDPVNDDNDTTTFEITFVSLTTKGTSYTFKIPSGLVKNDADVENPEKTNLTLSTSGIEKPVIRIYKPKQSITGCSATSSGTVDHPLSTTFKIDCRTPGVTLTYSYDCFVPEVCNVRAGSSTDQGGDKNIDTRQEEIYVDFVYDGKTYTNQLGNPGSKISGGKPVIVPVKNNGYSKAGTQYTLKSKIPLGKYNNNDIAYTNGLTYKITATANGTVSAYEAAYRTTLVLLNYSGYAATGRTSAYSYWPYQAEIRTNNCTIFLRGGENKEGANATAGLPASWNINEKDKVLMMKFVNNDCYFTSWNITVDKFYFQPLLGLCDSNTNTAGDGNNQGPLCSSYQQDGIIFRIPEYPIGKGEYMTVTMNGRYDIGIPGKVMNHR